MKWTTSTRDQLSNQLSRGNHSFSYYCSGIAAQCCKRHKHVTKFSHSKPPSSLNEPQKMTHSHAETYSKKWWYDLVPSSKLIFLLKQSNVELQQRKSITNQYMRPTQKLKDTHFLLVPIRCRRSTRWSILHSKLIAGHWHETNGSQGNDCEHLSYQIVLGWPTNPQTKQSGRIQTGIVLTNLFFKLVTSNVATSTPFVSFRW